MSLTTLPVILLSSLLLVSESILVPWLLSELEGSVYIPWCEFLAILLTELFLYWKITRLSLGPRPPKTSSLILLVGLTLRGFFLANCSFIERQFHPIYPPVLQSLLLYLCLTMLPFYRQLDQVTSTKLEFVKIASFSVLIWTCAMFLLCYALVFLDMYGLLPEQQVYADLDSAVYLLLLLSTLTFCLMVDCDLRDTLGFTHGNRRVQDKSKDGGDAFELEC